MSLRKMAFCAALLLIAAGLVMAQSNQPNEGFGAGQYPSYGQYPVYAQPQYANNQAYQIGYQDGVNDGTRDLQSNHAFRPTKTENYEDANHGYTSSLGDKNEYKAIYRQGYTAGYQQAFNGQAGVSPYPVYPQGPVYAPPQVYSQPPYGGNPGYQNGFQTGLNDGAADRQAGRQFRATDTMNYKYAPGYDKSYGDKDQYKQAFRQGYTSGYQQAYSGAAPVGAYPPPQAPVYGQPYPAPYPAYPPQYPVAGQPGQAYQIGYQDGLNDGAHDRQTGHGFRATKTERYEDAPGYNKSFGDKHQWKNIYRQGYVAGYQQAFGQ